MEDELALELDDNLGTTKRNDIFRLAQNPFPIPGLMWLLTTVSCEELRSSQSLRNDRTAGVSWKIYTVTKSSKS